MTSLNLCHAGIIFNMYNKHYSKEGHKVLWHDNIKQCCKQWYSLYTKGNFCKASCSWVFIVTFLYTNTDLEWFFFLSCLLHLKTILNHLPPVNRFALFCFKLIYCSIFRTYKVLLQLQILKKRHLFAYWKMKLCFYKLYYIWRVDCFSWFNMSRSLLFLSDYFV